MDLIMKLFQKPPNDIEIDEQDIGTEVDDRYFPYVVVTMKPYYIKNKQLRVFLTKMGELYTRAVKEKRRIILVLDTRELCYSKWEFIYNLAKWFLSMRNTTQHYVLCTVILSENEVFRNFVTNWLFKFVRKTRPNHTCASLEEGWIWLIFYLWTQAQNGTLHHDKNSIDD